MSKLQAALAWARRGFKVFPLEPNGKEPAHGNTWYDFATTDEAVIRSYWTDPVLGTERDYNIGCDCTDRVVVDVDVKNGKDGYNEYMQICSGEGWNTLVVRTPTGGFHLYFEGPDSSNAPIGTAVDIRSHHGYVVAPGSSIDGNQYVVYRDMEPTWLPLAIDARLRPHIERREVSLPSYADTDASIQAGRNYLQSAPIAVSGQQGNNQTFIVAARLVRELALSPAKALELLYEVYNPRCLPPWSLDELGQIVANAVNYGTAEHGRLDPETLFGGLALPPPPAPVANDVPWGNALDPEATPARDWLIDRVLMFGMVTLLVAAGAAGKSSLILLLAAHLALGKDFGSYKIRKAVKSVIYNGEDDIEEQSRRLQAICAVCNFDYGYVKNQILLLGEDDLDMRLVSSTGARTVAENMPTLNYLLAKLREPGVGMLALDPFVDVHSGEESDSGQMNYVLRLIKKVAKETHTAVILSHHTSKAGSAKQEDRVGNMDISRGSSAIPFKTRAVFTLMTASKQDAEEYGLQESERELWLRLDDAKMNQSLAQGKPTWFRKEAVKIRSGDIVGVIRPETLTKSATSLRSRVGQLLIDHMLSTNTSSIQLMQAVAFVKDAEPLFHRSTKTELAGKLEGMFTAPIDIRGHILSVRRPEKQGERIMLVMS